MYDEKRITPSTLVSFIRLLSKTISRNVITIIAGPSNLIAISSTGIATKREGTPNPIKILNILLPKTVPTASLLNPLPAE